MTHGALPHDDHGTPRSARGHAGATVTADPALAAALARCGRTGGFMSPDALAAVAGFARRAVARGFHPAQVATMVRRSFAAATPASMTFVTFETIAHCLVRHAMYSLHDD